MSNYSLFYDELLATIQDIWPEITTTVFYTEAQASRDNLINDIQSNGLVLPIAVIALGMFRDFDSIGLDTTQKRAPIAIWYVGKPEGDEVIEIQEEVEDKCYELGHYIDGSTFNTFQCFEQHTRDSSATNAFNQRVLKGQLTLYAGMVGWTPGFIMDDWTLTTP